MADEARDKRKAVERLPIMEVEPVADSAAADRADGILTNSLKANSEMGLVSPAYVTDKDLQDDPSFNFRKKLILAEYLRLVADSLDPAEAENVTLSNLRKGKQALNAAISKGVGQILQRARAREILANQVILWKANGTRNKDTKLPARHTSLVVGPNKLNKKGFQKVIDRQLNLSNYHIGPGEYRSFMFVPLDQLRGGTMALLPYMRMAQKYHMLLVGSLPVGDRLDSAEKIFQSWRFKITDVDKEDFETLSHATIILNNLVIRNAYKQYMEREPLTVGMEYAFAAQMTKYFQRKRDGHWYVPVLHPKIAAKDMRTVNTYDRRDRWHKCIENQFNFAYTTEEKQSTTEPGVRIIGATTVFPRGAVNLEEYGSEAVPLIQAQARAVKNRVFDQLAKELEKLHGGDYDESEVREIVHKYLFGLKQSDQIKSFEIVDVNKSELGVFTIKVMIGWSAMAEKFIVEAVSKKKESENP